MVESDEAKATYAVTREALATVLTGVLDSGDDSRGHRYAEADAILASGVLVDVNEVKAQALEELMRDSVGAFMAEVLRQRAAAIRAGRS